MAPSACLTSSLITLPLTHYSPTIQRLFLTFLEHPKLVLCLSAPFARIPLPQVTCWVASLRMPPSERGGWSLIVLSKATPLSKHPLSHFIDSTYKYLILLFPYLYLLVNNLLLPHFNASSVKAGTISLLFFAVTPVSCTEKSLNKYLLTEWSIE